MADRRQLEILRQGPEAWNRWREANRGLIPNLSGAELKAASLIGANLSGADLYVANIEGADLSQANLRRADLSASCLSGANLIGAYLGWANLRGADLSASHLRGANLRGANLAYANASQADLSGAKLLNTIFGNTDLAGVRGFDACVHLGPSTLDHRTIFISGGLPLSFLRGCGLPDALIDSLPSLLYEPNEFYSCFISLTIPTKPLRAAFTIRCRVAAFAAGSMKRNR